jgi:hypothetical protein
MLMGTAGVLMDRTLPQVERRQLLRANAPLVLAIVMLLIGCAAQSATYLNHDVAWVLYSSGLMLHGATFGTDIVAANPPLIWWLSAIPSTVAEGLGLPLVGTFRVFVLVVGAVSLFCADRFLLARTVPSTSRQLFLVVGAYLFTIGVHRDYGQREHLTVMLVLPYVLAVAHRLDGRLVSKASGLVLGLAAGIGIAFKPHFVLAPLLLEAALVCRTRSLRTLVRSETIGSAAGILLYAIAVLLVARPWLFGALPDISRVYWAFEQSDSGMLMHVLLALTLPLLGAVLMMRLNPSSQGLVLVLAAAGFFGAALLQEKFYSYHLYPVSTFLILALAVGIGGMPKPWHWAGAAVALIVLGSNGMKSAASLADRTDRGEVGKEVASAVRFLDAHVPPQGSFAAASTHPFPGFPTTLYAKRRWASASNSSIFLPAVVRLREAGARSDRELLGFAETKAREAMMRDLAKSPDVVLIDRRQYRHAIGDSKFDYLDFFMEDPAFRRAWSAYQEASSPPAGFAAYVRKRDSGL